MLRASFFVMPGLDPGIHAVTSQPMEAPMEWIAGSSPAMTRKEKRERNAKKGGGRGDFRGKEKGRKKLAKLGRVFS